MSDIVHLETISDMYRMLPQASVKHPLVAIVDFSNYQEQFNFEMKISLGFYSVMFKNFFFFLMKYGRQTYDIQEGSLI